MSWEREIVEWGNSMAIRLPSPLFRKTSLKEGDQLQFEIVDQDTIRLTLVDE